VIGSYKVIRVINSPYSSNASFRTRPTLPAEAPVLRVFASSDETYPAGGTSFLSLDSAGDAKITTARIALSSHSTRYGLPTKHTI